MPKRWIVHPAAMAGDSWHAMGAYACEPADLRLVIVAHKDVRSAWIGSQKGFYEATSKASEEGKPLSLDAKLEHQRTGLAGFIKIAGENLAKKPEELVAINWKETTALLEGLVESKRSPDSYVLVPGMETQEGGTHNWDPYTPVATALALLRTNQTEGNAKEGKIELTMESGVKDHVSPGDMVGIAQAMTSCIAKKLHEERAGTYEILREGIAPAGEGVVASVKLVLKKLQKRVSDELKTRDGERAPRVLLVLMRNAKENTDHNTSKEVLQTLCQENAKVGRRWPLLPLGNLPKDASSGLKEAFLQPFDFFKELEAVDGRAFPLPSQRSVLCEFWRQVAAAGNFALFGGRSGSLDIAAFMGVQHVFCFDVRGPALDHGNVRLLLTWRLMHVGYWPLNDSKLVRLLAPLDLGLFQADLGEFLDVQHQDPVFFQDMVADGQGYTAAYEHKKDGAWELITKKSNVQGGKRHARLMYTDSEFPSVGDFFRLGSARQAVRKPCVICGEPGTRHLTCKTCKEEVASVCNGYLCEPQRWRTQKDEKPSLIPLLNLQCSKGHDLTL